MDSGADQISLSDLTISISGGSLSESITETVRNNYSDAAFSAYGDSAFDLTGNTISAGTYTITVTNNNFSGGGAFISDDGFTLEGLTAIPEPSTYAFLIRLLALGAAATRRRK